MKFPILVCPTGAFSNQTGSAGVTLFFSHCQSLLQFGFRCSMYFSKIVTRFSVNPENMKKILSCLFLFCFVFVLFVYVLVSVMFDVDRFGLFMFVCVVLKVWVWV